MNTVVYGQNYIPEPLIGNAAVFVESELKIYYIGGINFNYDSNDLEFLKSDFFYFNCDPHSKETFAKWTDLKSQGVNFPLSVFHIADIGGVNQDSIFIVGGVRVKNPNDTYRFNIKTNELSIPVIQGKAPPMRARMNSVSYKGKIYIFGGLTGFGSNITFYNNFDILDTVNLIWQIGSTVNSPVTRSEYTATLVDEVIYYIGGRTQQYIFSPMTEIFQYDIVRDTWSLKTATFANTNITPGPRAGHSAVLYDTKIFVYGGAYFNNDTLYKLPPNETFVMLDTTTLVWAIPSINDTTDVPKLAYHTATLLYDIMIVAFGNHTDLPDSEDKSNNLTYIFDLSNRSHWFVLPTTIITTPPNTTVKLPTTADAKTPQYLSSSNKMVIVGVIVGLVAVIGMILVILASRRRIKAEREFNHPDCQVQISSIDCSSVRQQHASQQLQQQNISRTSTPPIQQHLTQSQEHSESSVLLQESSSQHSSN
ncbi:hypothetical protein C1645_841232 [Glomus cerebriforme]|uniref:Galactose oxidase n=1 Tax=Glomus cerebriforme TaxID=658196 RepID=A0A397S923_9GLOM|nr:hypothetical protein C1645_841232 [Glomus cerebriforme]